MSGSTHTLKGHVTLTEWNYHLMYPCASFILHIYTDYCFSNSFQCRLVSFKAIHRDVQLESIPLHYLECLQRFLYYNCAASLKNLSHSNFATKCGCMLIVLPIQVSKKKTVNIKWAHTCAAPLPLIQPSAVQCSLDQVEINQPGYI